MATISACTIYFDENASRSLKLFPVFLLLTFCVEVTAILVSNRGYKTVLLYNIFTTLEFAYYFWFFKSILQQPTVKKILSNLIWLFPLSALLDKLFIQKGFLVFLSITYSFGCLFIVAAAIMYFYELFQTGKSVNLIRERTFWISSGFYFIIQLAFRFLLLLIFFSANCCFSPNL